MREVIDLSWQKYERLTVIRRVPASVGTHIRWLCRCACGSETIVRGANLRNGGVKSCGCLQIDTMKARITHGMARVGMVRPEWEAWSHIRDRCENPDNANYFRYGGRGIRVCDEWSTFEQFYADMGDRPAGMTSIERIDNDGPYCKTNCKWSYPKEQARNRRSNRVVEHCGRRMTLKEAAEMSGISYKVVWARVVQLGWPLDRALSEPVVLGRNQYD